MPIVSASISVPARERELFGGRSGPLVLAQTAVNSFPPLGGVDLLTVVHLHASAAGSIPYPTNAGHVYLASCSDHLADPARNSAFSVSASQTTVSGITAASSIQFNPRDSDINSPREYLHCGWSVSVGAEFSAISERRYTRALRRLLATYPQADRNRIVWTGGSMGGWASLRIGIKQPDLCSLVASSRPRWRSTNTAGQIAMPVWTNYSQTYAIDSAPALSAADGGVTGRVYFDLVKYVNESPNWIPPVIWCVGRNDGFTPFSEHVEAKNALLARGVPFQFSWNNGDHSVGDILAQMGTAQYHDYRIDRGCPLFTNCSRDQDPAVDVSGSINLGLRFRNVSESASAWSCEVTRMATALDASTTGCTVNVKPYSRAFTAAVAAQSVTIPSAGTWVPVSFTG